MNKYEDYRKAIRNFKGNANALMLINGKLATDLIINATQKNKLFKLIEVVR